MPTTGDSNTIICKKFTKCELEVVARNPEEWLTELELLRGYLQKCDVHLDDSKNMTHILSNLPKEYQKIVEILDD